MYSVCVAGNVLTVVFGNASALLAQERHLAKGGFFLPAPDPLPEPLAEIVLRVESPPDRTSLELTVRAVQMSQTAIALALLDAVGARAALAPILDVARAAPTGGEGTTLVFWGRREPGREEPEVDAEEQPDAQTGLLSDQIRAMGSPEKMQLALKGDRTARLILLKDVNKSVQTFLLQNPRITIDEIRYIAGYRQANPEVLAAIAAHREWGQNQYVIAALVRNPKTPATASVKLLDKIGTPELRRLAKSNDVPRAVQAAARKKVTE
jgi:hypothetical protein